MTNSQQDTLELFFAIEGSEADRKLKEFTANLQKIMPDFSDSDVLLFARGLLAKETTFNSLNPIEGEAFFKTALDMVREFGVKKSLPTLQKILGDIAAKKDDRP